MDTKKLKNFIDFKLPLVNFRTLPKTRISILKEIRVFDQAPLEPACPICGYLLERPPSDLTDSHKLSSHGWRCSTCDTPVVFNEEPQKDLKQVAYEAADASR